MKVISVFLNLLISISSFGETPKPIRLDDPCLALPQRRTTLSGLEATLKSLEVEATENTPTPMNSQDRYLLAAEIEQTKNGIAKLKEIINATAPQCP